MASVLQVDIPCGNSKPMKKDFSKAYLDNLIVNRQREWTEFPKVDFNCFNGQYSVALKGINI